MLTNALFQVWISVGQIEVAGLAGRSINYSAATEIRESTSAVERAPHLVDLVGIAILKRAKLHA